MQAQQIQRPPSQQVAYCYYCGKTCKQRKNLPKHIERHHPFETYREATEEEAAVKWEHSTEIRRKEAKDIANVRDAEKRKLRESKQRETALEKLEEKFKKDEQRKRKVEDLTAQREIAQPNKRWPPRRRATTSSDTLSPPRLNHDSHLNVLNDASNHPTTSRGIIASAARQTCSPDSQVELPAHNNASGLFKAILPEKIAFDKKFSQLRSVDDLVSTGMSFKKDVENGRIVCIPCNTHFSKGVINYNFAAGQDFRNTEMHEKFSELKRRMKEHIFLANCHKLCVEMENNDGKFVTDDQNRTAGMVVARAAYNCIKKNLGDASVEKELQSAEANFLSIGDINHSRAISQKLRNPFYENLKKHVIQELNKPLVSTGKPAHFSIVADKATPNSDTLHIIGIIIPRQQKPEAVFLGAVDNKDGTGPGLAVEIQDLMLQFFTEDEIKTRMTGITTDGQYIRNLVGASAKRLNNIPEDDKIITFVWDAAHGLELAGKDARGQTSTDGRISEDFIRITYDVIQSIGNASKFGKAWNTLKDLRDTNNAKKLRDGETLDMRKQKLKKFKSFSTTRFTTYSKDTIRAFRDNFCEIYQQLNKEKDTQLNNIQNSSFVLRLNGLYDVYEQVGDLSLNMQRTDYFTFTVDQCVDESLERLRSMENALNSHSHEIHAVDGLKNFSSAVKELRENGTHQGMPIINNRQAPVASTTRARSARTSRQDGSYEEKILSAETELAGHIQKLRQKIGERFYRTRPDMLVWTRNVFSIQQLINLPFQTFPRYLGKLVGAAKSSSVLDPDVTMEVVQEEFRNFSQVFKAEYDARNLGSSEDSKLQMQEIYMKILNSDAREYPAVAKLLSVAAGKTYCESITEGFGSVISRRITGRQRIETARLSEEVFIELNGPNAGRACNGLLVQSLDDVFNGKPWRFNRTSEPRKLVPRVVSKPVDKHNKNPGKFGSMDGQTT